MCSGSRILNASVSAPLPYTTRANPYKVFTPVTVLASDEATVVVHDLSDGTYCIVTEAQIMFNGRTVRGKLSRVFLDVNKALEAFHTKE